ncbi:MAG: FimV/HubP family polar landmark protein [Gammaproteobacteria bacterium]|nr:FimV/HubP family polar landmark protein [Gammaproteobacteria bacterium]
MNAIKATMSVRWFRTFGLIAGWAAVLLPIQAHALSLGGFQVESVLDEPLRAEIQLESVDADALETLEVSLGSAEDFQRADVPRTEYLQQLQFTVSERDGGSAVVVVTTEQPIKEPFLHFLVAAEWSNGKLVREYTGLLDPPLYAGQSPAAVESPAIETGQTAPETAEPASADTTGTMTSSPASTSSGRSAEYGPTREGDTLWGIASRLDTGPVQANVFQIMIALQRQNPDAFIDNNVNRLKTGATLRLNDIAAVADISSDQASASYTAQLEEWESFKTRVAGASAEAGDTAASVPAPEEAETADAETASDQAATDIGTASETAAAPEQQEEDVLRIVQATVDDAEQSESAAAGAGASQEVAELRAQVATLQETLESRNLENEELRERVRLMESQLENAQRLIEIESQELAAAQQQAAQAQQEAEQAGTQQEPAGAETEQAAAEPVQPIEEAGQESMDPEPVMEDAGDAARETASASDPQESQSAQQASAAGSAGDSAQSGDTTRVRADSGGSSQGAWWAQMPDMLFSSWMWMVGAGIGVLVLVLGLLMFLRRRQSIAEFEESILSGSALDSYSETTDTAATSASDTSFLSDFGTAGMGTMQADEVDPLAEAEVYLAYGRDEQAEDVLKEAARRDPDRAEVKLKLLEIYKQRSDVKSFETIAEELYPAGDSGDREVWNQVTAMGRELSPGNPLFQDNAAGATDADLATAGDPASAAELYPAAGEEAPAPASFDRERPAPASAEAPGGPADSDLGFELDADMAPESETPVPATAERDESLLDFGEEFLERPSGNVDPATQPFPAPDQQTDLDRELERLAGEREAATTPAPGESAEEAPSQAAAPDWEKADSDDGGTLDFPASDTSEIDFDLDLDDNSIEQLGGSGSASETDVRQSPEEDDAAALTAESAGEGLLEFESENIPPEETWAGPSSDATPVNDDELVAYSPDDDVQAAGAPQYNEAETKLDLARAYLDMGDKVGARSIIDEVMREGDPAQRDQAAELAAQL